MKIIKNSHFILIYGNWDGMVDIMRILNSYASMDDVKGLTLWLQLKIIQNSLTRCWLLTGDFNEKRHKIERFSNYGCESTMEAFNDFMRGSQPFDFKLVG